MKCLTRFSFLLAAGLALTGLTGCAPTLTNLTPTSHVRNASGIYNFEVMWSSRDATIRKDSMRPFVVVGTEKYPMKPSPMLPNRWEAAVPLSPTKEFINYRYKFDFLQNSIGEPQGNSRLSAPYQLRVTDH